MNDHRPPQNPGLEGNHLAKAAKELTSEGQLESSWYDEVVKKAYGPIGFAKDTFEHAPVGTTITALGIGVGLYGAVKTGLAGRALTALGEGEVVGGGSRALAGAAEREALAGGTEALANAGKTMVHLTTAEGQVGIASTLRIGSRWGIFAIDSAQVPEHAFVRKVASLVPKELTAEVQIGPNATRYFKAPTPVGPFTLARNLAGVKSTPLGSIDLAKDAFIPNEIFSKGVFRPATGTEVAKYKVHQWLLDYSIDSLGYTLAGISTAALEYKQICDKADQNRLQTQSQTYKHLHK